MRDTLYLVDGPVKKKVLGLAVGRGGGAGSPGGTYRLSERQLKDKSSSREVSSVDKLSELREFLWCDHVGVSIQSVFKEYSHVSLLSPRAVHIVVEQGKVKVLCHSCFCTAMQTRLKLQ